ncbi:serine hydrolase domain-containing protein [Aliivibrio kagoshimensis]|uniref:serine hydrolase domain-containing protein n=1 Tax=Aliivibrio kagoshimensis TaxID=2910230 RepID=UPI003D1308C9
MGFKQLFKIIISILSVITLIVVAYVSPYFLFAPENIPPPAITSIEDVEEYIEAQIDIELPSAMNVTVLKRGEPIFSRAYGVSNGITGKKASLDNVYHFYSATKSVTAVAIMQLVEKGKLDLNRSITEYLPEFEPVDSSGDPIKVSVKNLLSHRSGLPGIQLDMFKWLHFSDQAYVGDLNVVKRYLQDYRTVDWAPGSDSEYRNINYILLGAIIDAVTEGSYEDYVRQNILTPLKMYSSDFIYRDDMLERAAIGAHPHYNFITPLINYNGMEGGMDALAETRIDDMYWLKTIYTDFSASTSLMGTGSDLARFGQMLLNGGELDGVRILSKTSVNSILYQGRYVEIIEKVKNKREEFAIGNGTKTWFHNGIELIGHGGSGPGYKMQYYVVPSKEMVVVVLTNATGARATRTAKMLASQL